ncbi:MAG: cysteine peptidase family C39 domain-containing protein [Tenericutes bacterium]|nr:cysteine peptidase family C39 domain-containing protein [Mycoplasmatota bacterium]
MININRYVIRQEEEKDCGASCLASIVKYYNGYVPLEIIRNDTLTDYNGTNFYNIKMAAIKYGFDVMGYNNEQIIPPYIVQIKINDCYHFMVIYKITDEYLIVMDPGKGIIKYSKEDFNKIFTGYMLKLIPNGKIVKYDKKNGYLSFLKKLVKNNIKNIIVCFILTIIIIILNLSETYLIKDVLIYKVFIKELLIILLIKLSVNWFKNNILIKINKKINIELVNNYISKYFKLSYKYLYLKSSGDIINRIKDLNKIKNYLVNEVVNFSLNLLMMLIVTIILFIINYKLTIVVILIYIMTFIVCKCINKEILKKYNELIYLDNLYMDRVSEYVSKILTINSLNINSFFINKLNDKSKLVANLNFRVDKLNNYLNIFLEFIGIFVMIIILGMLYRSNLDNIIVYILYYNYFKECVYYFITFNVSYSYLKLVIDRINGVYYLKNYDKSKGLEFKNDDIIINDLSYSYGLNKVFDKINYKIKVGSKVLIKGNNGSGKSTLINILTKNIDDYNGKVSIGYDIRDISYNSYLEHISYINQDSGLFEDSIINNIVLNNEIDNNKLDEIIKILNLDEVIKNKERGINTLIKDNFSGGEKQKIIIARCLYKCSDIMVFDEAFSEISSNDRINIINKINDVYRDKTIIYVNHFNDYIKYDQILEIKGTRKDKVDE